MPLRNRVTQFGEPVAHPGRGLVYGKHARCNRAGLRMRGCGVKGLIGVALVLACAGAAVSSAAGRGGRAGDGILFVYRPRLAVVVGGDIYDLIPGHGVRRLTQSANAKFDPHWSPSGTEIAYTAMVSNGVTVCGPCTQEVWVARADGSHARQITSIPNSGPATSDEHPSWSPDGARIVFERDFASRPLGELVIVPARGGRETDLGIAGADPTWGKRGIAYVAGKSIRLIRPGARRATLFAAAARGVAAVAWSRSDELAALEGRAYGRRVVIFAASGRQLARFPLPAPLFGALGITWSPDAEHLLLSGWVRGVRPGLYETDGRGKTLRHVVARINAWGASWR
jgi:WD40-like Beta Propeller Repeat